VFTYETGVSKGSNESLQRCWAPDRSSEHKFSISSSPAVTSQAACQDIPSWHSSCN